VKQESKPSSITTLEAVREPYKDTMVGMKRRAFWLPRMLPMWLLIQCQCKGVSGVERVQREAGDGFQHKQGSSHLSYLELVAERKGRLDER
jgi:hypothetical protein